MGGRRARALSRGGGNGCGAPLLALCASCASYGSHLSATPLPAGADERALSLDVLIIDRGFGPQVVPNPEASLRRGIGGEVDLGARVNVGSVEVNARWRWLHVGQWELTLVPGAGFGFVPVTNADTGLFNLNALGSLLAGLDLGGRRQILLGARAVATYAFPLTAFRGEASGAKMIYLAGGVLGVRWAVGKKTSLFPDVSVLLPYDSERENWYFPSIQGGISLQFE